MIEGPMDEKTLLRLLHGELSSAEAADLQRRLSADPAAAARLESLGKLWTALQAPPSSGVPRDFARRVMERVEGLAGPKHGVSGMAWRRLSAALALSLGMALGLGIGRLPIEEVDSGAYDLVAEPSSLAAGYGLALAGGEGQEAEEEP